MSQQPPQPLFNATQVLRTPWDTHGAQDAVRPLAAVLRDAGEPQQTRQNESTEQRAGFEKGYQEGLQSAKKLTNTLMDRYQQAVKTLAEAREQILAQSHDDMVRLAVHVATQLVMSDMRVRTDMTARMIEHCVTLLKEADSITVQVSSTDLQALREHHPEALQHAHVQIVEDASINVGGVRARCALGSVDATLQTRIRAMAQQMLGEGDAERVAPLAGEKGGGDAER